MVQPSGSPPAESEAEEDPAESVTSPTVIHRGLSMTLRLLREQAGLRQADVAKSLNWSHGKVGHIETRHVKMSVNDVRLLLDVYGVPKDKQAQYLWFVERAREKGWWDGAPGVPDWFTFFIGLEWGASSCTTFNLGYVPGLLQTRRYAHAVLAEAAAPDKDVDDQLGQRMRRQEVLTRPKRPLRLHAIIDEGVLRRPVGGPAVMTEQLLSLRDKIHTSLADSPTRSSNLTIQVLPLSAGNHGGLSGSFTHLRFPHDEDIDADADLVKLREQQDAGICYFENQFGGVYLDEKKKVEKGAADLEDLAKRALSPAQSAILIDDLAQKMGV